MSSMFPPTSLTLLQKLAVEVTGGNEAAWVRFFGLYTPAMRRFIEWNDQVHDPDDVIQEVYLKLVGILESGKYQADKAHFRTFLSMLIRHQLIAMYRKEQSRGGSGNLSLDELTDGGGDGVLSPSDVPSVPAVQGDAMDLAWAKAKRESAVEHVLTKVAMKQQTRDIYRAYVIENRAVNEVSAAFKVSPDIIYKVKNRVDKMIEAVVEEYSE